MMQIVFNFRDSEGCIDPFSKIRFFKKLLAKTVNCIDDWTWSSIKSAEKVVSRTLQRSCV